MINFEYITLFLFLATTAICGLAIVRILRYKHLFKLTKIHVLRAAQKKENSFYCEAVLKKCFRMLFFSNSKKARKAFAALVCGRVEPAVEIISVKKPTLATFLSAHSDIKSAYTRLKNSKKTWQKNKLYSLLFALMSAKFFDYAQINSVLKKIKAKQLIGIKKAYYNLVSSYVYVTDADMLSASQNASFALKFFQKNDMAMEEAATYLLLGEIYRISCVHDVAQTMMESALKIYRRFKLPLFEARALAVVGMLMVFENRLEEAQDRFDEALKIAETEQTKAEILNQAALLEIARKDYKKSAKKVAQALALHEKVKNKRGIALSLQISAHLSEYKKHPHKAVESATKAAKIYLKQKNFSAYCECLYLAATVFYKQKNFKQSEQLLRQILEISKKYLNNFHQANVYSLLGLIYLQKNDLQRAKSLLQQSLYLEQRNDRTSGLAADYANLSLIEELNGDKTTAAANLQTALDYAMKTENEELIQLIKNRI